MSVTNVQKFVAALVGPVQDLETMWHQMRAMRNVNTAVGVHLERLGKIVGRPREGVTDDELYRRLIRAQITVNRSTGTIDELLRVAELVVFDDDAEYVAENTGVAAMILRVEDIALDWTVATWLARLLRRAVLGGVRLVEEFLVAEGDDPDQHLESFRFAGFGEPQCTFPGKVVIGQLDSAVGRTVEIKDSGFGVPSSLDESDPMNIIVKCNIADGDGQLNATWATVYALINGSAYVYVVEELEAGAADVTSDNFAVEEFVPSGGEPGLGFADLAPSWDLTDITGDWNVEGTVGISSVETLAGDGYVEFIAINDGNWFQLGLAPDDTTTNFGEPGVYGLMLRQDVWLVEPDSFHARFGGGVESLDAVFEGPWLSTDLWRLQRVGSTITLHRNGVVIYTYTTPSVGPLRVDLAALSTDGTITKVRLVDNGHRVRLTWQNAANVTATPRTDDYAPTADGGGLASAIDATK